MEQSEEFSIFDVAGDNDATVVNVTGEIDMETGPAFQRGLLSAIGAGRSGLIVDLSQATFLDSSALTSLVNAFDNLRRHGGGRLAIVATHPPLRGPLRGARPHPDLHIYQTPTGAGGAA